MWNERKAERVQQEIIRLCHAGLDRRTLTTSFLQSLRRVVPVDAYWSATTDPATLLFTGSVIEGIPEQETPRFVTNEFLEDDVNHFRHLVRAHQPAQNLYTATESHPDNSARYRDILAPMGLGDELRAVFVTASTCWGVLCLHREQGASGFSDEEIAFVHRLTPHLATGLRLSLLIGGEETVQTVDGPGLLLLDDDFSLLAVTPPADQLLAEVSDWPERNELPQAVYAIAARLQSLERDPDITHALAPRARIRTRAGRWLVLHASRLMGPSREGRIAIVLEVARPAEVAPLLLSGFGLTPREAEVAEQVLRGLSTTEIANTLFISAYTVQEHLKSVFDKVGVRSRRELAARVFADQYLPRVLNGTPVGADGWFIS